STTITDPSSVVSFTATSHSSVYSQAIGFAGSGLFSGDVVRSTSTLTHTVRAFTQNGGSSSASSISFTANANDNFTDGTNCGVNFAACATVTSGAVSLRGSLAVHHDNRA